MKVSGELPFGQVPALRTTDGKNLLVQSAAIYRFIGKHNSSKKPASLYPQDFVDAAKVDAILDQDNSKQQLNFVL